MKNSQINKEKHPALGLMMYDFLGHFKERLLYKIKNNYKTFNYYVSNKRLESLENITSDYINDGLKNLLNQYKNKNNDDIIFRVEAIVKNQVEKAKNTDDIAKRFEYLIWPYFFVKIKDDNKREKMMTWFPVRDIYELDDKFQIYPTHVFESKDTDLLTLWTLLENVSTQGGIQEVLDKKDADSAGVNSFQPKIIYNLFERQESIIKSLDIDLLSGNCSLWQCKISSQKDCEAQGLISLCSPLIGFFHPKYLERNTFMINGRGYSDIKGKHTDFKIEENDFYGPVYNTFKEVNGGIYLKAFTTELKQINEKIVGGTIRKTDDIIFNYAHDMRTILNRGINEPLKNIINNISDKKGILDKIKTSEKIISNLIDNFDILLKSYKQIIDEDYIPTFLKISGLNDVNSFISKNNISDLTKVYEIEVVPFTNITEEISLKIDKYLLMVIINRIILNSIDIMCLEGVIKGRVEVKFIMDKLSEYVDIYICNSGTKFDWASLNHDWGRVFTAGGKKSTGMGLHSINEMLRMIESIKYKNGNYILLNNDSTDNEILASIAFRIEIRVDTND